MVEMIVVMALFGIIAAIAAPSFRDFVIRRSISAQVSDLGAALRLARSEAIKRGAPVTLCPTTAPHEAAPACSGGREWANGYLVLIDNGNAPGQYLRVQQRYGNHSRITAATAGSIVFMGNGIMRATSPAEFRFGPDLPGTDTTKSPLNRTVCISSTGSMTAAPASGTCS